MLVDLLSEDAHHLFRQLVASGGRRLEGNHDKNPALQELIRRGLAWESDGPAPIVYAVSPITAMRLLLSNEQQRVIHAHRRIIEQYAELESLERGCSADTPAGVELLTGPAAITTIAYELMVDARAECRSIHSPTAGELRLPSHRPDSAVRHRRLVVAALLEDPGAREAIDTAEANGIEHRILTEVPAPMVVTENAALVWLRPPPDGAALLIRGGAMVESLAWLFDLLWKPAVPFAAPAAAGSDLPSAVQLQILRLAATGLKDEAIARSLGRSVRWVRRHFELLEERLEATNRMTLGIAATRRGWL